MTNRDKIISWTNKRRDVRRNKIFSRDESIRVYHLFSKHPVYEAHKEEAVHFSLKYSHISTLPIGSMHRAD